MENLITFALTEVFALGGQYTWRLKESEIRFRGSGEFAGLVNRRIPASEKQIFEFCDALEFLDVGSWRSDYTPEDLGFACCDGSAWSFSMSFSNQTHQCGGVNAYPSFADPVQTTMQRGRFALLLAAMYASFDIDTYIHIAKYQKERGIE